MMDPVSSSKVKAAIWEEEPRRIDPGRNLRLDGEVVLSRFSLCFSFSLSFGDHCDCETDAS